MLNNKIWKLSSSQEKYTDEQLIELIKSGKIGPDERIATREMKKWIKVKDSIYQKERSCPNSTCHLWLLQLSYCH